MSTAGPDIQGFKDAQNRLREATGSDVVFRIPVAPVYADGTPLDENGEPYSPTAVVVSGGGYTEITKRVGVNYRPLTRGDEDQVESGPQGVSREQAVTLDVATADFSDVSQAEEFVLFDIAYKITDAVSTGLTTPDRYLVYGAAQ